MSEITWRVVTTRRFKNKEDYQEFIDYIRSTKEIPEMILKKILSRGSAEIYTTDGPGDRVSSHTIWKVTKEY